LAAVIIDLQIIVQKKTNFKIIIKLRQENTQPTNDVTELPPALHHGPAVFQVHY